MVRLRTLVWRELAERRNQLATSFLSILLAIAAIVAIQDVTYYSEKAVAKELDALGANVLVLPKSASLRDYYASDLQEDEFPEDYLTRLTNSDLQGLDNLSPKFSVPVVVAGARFTLTGLLPKNEFQAKAAWQGAGIFARPPAGCGTVVALPGLAPPAKETLVRKRVIETLGESDALVGAEVAATLKLKEGARLTLLGKEFTLVAVLPETGTVDDSRVFAHLHTVQGLAGKGRVLNAIEIVGCCQEISNGLVQKINALLPDAKVPTVAQVVDTQVRTNQLMAKLSSIFLLIIVVVGGLSMANYMYANVSQRRREIGTMMALGADSSAILRMFLLKAGLLGLAGGLGGYLLGTLAAVLLGPQLAGIPVLPMPALLAWVLVLSPAVALAASYFPARYAAGLDPCTSLQEV